MKRKRQLPAGEIEITIDGRRFVGKAAEEEIRRRGGKLNLTEWSDADFANQWCFNRNAKLDYARLKQERPDLMERVANGDPSATAEAVEAGFGEETR
jgi:hypothetical protein